MIAEFVPIARAIVALSDLKIISFGPRPLNFLACNARSISCISLGVEIEENLELDLFEAFNKHAGDARIPGVVADMEKNWVQAIRSLRVLEKLAQYELDLKRLDRGAQRIPQVCCHRRKMLARVPDTVRFVPCYVNSRLTGQGIPVSLRG